MEYYSVTILILSYMVIKDNNFVIYFLLSQFGVYSTRFRQGSAGFPKCDIRRQGHEIRNISIIGNENKVRIIYSPGFTLEPQEK